MPRTALSQAEAYQRRPGRAVAERSRSRRPAGFELGLLRSPCISSTTTRQDGVLDGSIADKASMRPKNSTFWPRGREVNGDCRSDGSNPAATAGGEVRINSRPGASSEKSTVRMLPSDPVDKVSLEPKNVPFWPRGREVNGDRRNPGGNPKQSSATM